MDLVAECEKGNLENVKYLIEQDSNNILIVDYYPLRAAAWYGHFEVVKYLVEQGADISSSNYLSLRLAVYRDQLKILNYFRRVLGDEIPCYECLVRPACLKLCF